MGDGMGDTAKSYVMSWAKDVHVEIDRMGLATSLSNADMMSVYRREGIEQHAIDYARKAGGWEQAEKELHACFDSESGPNTKALIMAFAGEVRRVIVEGKAF
jgi:hypothetical protein